MIVRGAPGTMPQVDTAELEARIVQATRRWQDDLADALLAASGEAAGNRLLRRYAEAFPAGYREDYPARSAVRDVELAEAASHGNGLAMNLYRPIEAPAGMLRLKVYHVGAPIALSHSLPLLEHLGVRVNDERPTALSRPARRHLWMHDFGTELADGAESGSGRAAEGSTCISIVSRPCSRMPSPGPGTDASKATT